MAENNRSRRIAGLKKKIEKQNAWRWDVWNQATAAIDDANRELAELGEQPVDAPKSEASASVAS